MSTIIIKTWLDSGANIHSAYRTDFEIDSEEWTEMSDKEKDEYAKEYAWGRMDWGWVVKEEK